MKKIAFQGEKGAYSDLACRSVYPDIETVPCVDFMSALQAVEKGHADLAMIPVDNSLAGRVAVIHQLLPQTQLNIIGEFFLPVHHCLLGVSGASIEDIKQVRSHTHALPQCHDIISRLKLEQYVSADTAAAAREVSQLQDKSVAAISSSLAAEIYDLEILKENIEDAAHNTTRFLVFAPSPQTPEVGSCDAITTLIFRVRNLPAALYKVMGGFATNGVNITKLESYMVDGQFEATQFYCDIEGHIDDPQVRLAFEELDFFAAEVRVLGCYPAHAYRRKEN